MVALHNFYTFQNIDTFMLQDYNKRQAAYILVMVEANLFNTDIVAIVLLALQFWSEFRISVNSQMN